MKSEILPRSVKTGIRDFENRLRNQRQDHQSLMLRMSRVLSIQLITMNKNPRLFFLFVRSLVITCGLVCTVMCGEHCFGQAGLREALERLDRDGDGKIKRSEVTPLARPYLERIMKSSRLSIYRDDNDIDDLLNAARRYYATQNGVSEDRVRPEVTSQLRSFEPDPEQPLVPEFGLGEVKYPYIKADLDLADSVMRGRDKNKDGFIDRKEASYERWTHRDPFADDSNGDDRLTRLELAQRYARRRLLDQVSDELRQKAWRTYPSKQDGTGEREDRTEWWRRGGNSYWLAATIVSRFDTNRNGRLEVLEVKELGMPVGQIDIDRDGELSREEMFAYLEPIQKEVGELTEGVPGWFFELDANDDGQVSMSEFASEWTNEKMAEFQAFDLNQDALLTMDEITRSKTLMGGSFANRSAEMLPPGKTVVSEIIVEDDLLVADLNVQVSITHTHTSYLDGFLTGPDGQRIELFAGIGGHDDNFDNTVFDDQGRYPINKARPPFEGSFQPMALLKRQPSLGHYNGKNAKGVWQLVLRGTRSDRFGMLHYWSLNIRPQEKLPGEVLEVLEDPNQKEGENPADSAAQSGDAKAIVTK